MCDLLAQQRVSRRGIPLGGSSCGGGHHLNHGCDKTVSLARDSLYKARLLGIVPQHLANLTDSAVNAVIGIEKDALSPDPLNDLLTGH